jgi:protein-disulfide isomerase
MRQFKSLAYVAGLAILIVAISGCTVSAEIKNAAADGAREAVQTEIPALQATTVVQVGQIVGTEVAKALANQAGIPAIMPTETPVVPVKIDLGNSPVWGNPDAKVTIVEYSDFQCIFCEQFFTQTYPQIKQDYGDRILFVFKHFPIASIHPDAERAANAAECAHEQGKFWEYHDTLFSNQDDLSRAALIKDATTAGITDMTTFTQCVDSGKYAATVQADEAQGISIGVNGTPSFFINGMALVGAQPYAVFKSALDRAFSAAGGN